MKWGKMEGNNSLKTPPARRADTLLSNMYSSERRNKNLSNSSPTISLRPIINGGTE